jgi:hypothetical protein
MKKIIAWGIYFLVCAVVIVAAVSTGKRQHQCRECEIAFGKKENAKELAGWERIVSKNREK